MNGLSPILAMGAALLGNALLSLGMVLQKRFVGWMVPAGARTGRRPGLAGWIAGFVLMNLQPVFNFIALGGLPANVVAAAGGSCVAFAALFSWPLLREPLDARRVAWTAMLFASIAVAGFSGTGGSGSFSKTALYASFLIPVALAGAYFLLPARKPKGLGASLVAVIAGSLGGFMVLAMQALRMNGGNSLGAWLGAPYLYLYIVGGVGAFALSQLAYREGKMALVAPLYYGMQVLWPALASYAVFGAGFDLVQVLAYASIAASIAGSAGSSERAAGPGSEGTAGKSG